jgi:hypothetical protein
MQQDLASVTRRSRRVLPRRDRSGCVHLEPTVHSLTHDQLDRAAQVEIQRWEDDGGAIVTDGRRVPALAAHNAHARAA